MKTIRLACPNDKSKISVANPRLRWLPIHGQNLSYSLTVFATRPGIGTNSGRLGRSKPLPLFSTKTLKRNFYDLPVKAKGLKPGRTYWWQVSGQDKNGHVRAISEKRSFKVMKMQQGPDTALAEVRDILTGPYRVCRPTAVAGEAWWAHPENLLPKPPILWGKPVRLRWRSELEAGETPEPDFPDDGPGTVDPLPLIWGSGVAADLYLPYYLAQHANLYWDLSHIEGCQQVLLQISGPEGFNEPNDGDVLHDSGVVNYYWGPPRISCGYDELESPLGPPPMGTMRRASNINLLSAADGGGSDVLPSEAVPEIMRQIRTVPCNDSREPVDVASDAVNLHCVRYPSIEITAQVSRWSWGENPGRTIEFSLMLNEPFPNVRSLVWDEESGRFVSPTAPSTLLIYTPPAPSMMDMSTMANLSLTMDGEPVERRNDILLTYRRVACDTYVIDLPQWPSVPGYTLRLEQQWRGGLAQITLWDFLEPHVVAAVIPGVAPDWHYCDGVYGDYDSLYGRDDLPDEPTNSPFFYYHQRGESCLPGGMIDSWTLPSNGIMEFNDFMESAFRGTRTVVLDERIDSASEIWLDEMAGTRDVEVRFETDNTNDLRYILPSTTQPVMMRETRGSGDVLWQMKYLDGKYAAMWTTGRSVDILYAGRAGELAGRSQFDPHRMQIWLSVRVGQTARGVHVWADIRYDLSAV